MKKKTRRFLILYVALLISLFSKTYGGSIQHTVAYDYNKFTLTNRTFDNVVYSNISYNGLFNNSGEPGMPSLPVDYLKFSVPYNATNISVFASYTNYKSIYIDHQLFPCQPDTQMNDTLVRPIVPPDSSIYYSGDFFPLSKAWLVNDEFFAGENRVLTIALAPVSYRFLEKGSMKHMLSLAQRVNIIVNYDINDDLDKIPLISCRHSKRNEGYKLTQRIVVNPESVIDNAPTQLTNSQLLQYYSAYNPINAQAILPKYLDDTIETPVNYYTIITPDSLQASLKKIAAFKQQKGYITKIETVENIINQYISNNLSGNSNEIDSAKIIRQYLISSFYNGEVGFVLMAGKDVPFKFAYRHQYPTDQYYSDLTEDWSDSFDYCPDVYVGRIIARRQEQICNYTDKLLRYELNPGRGDFSYLKRALYTNGYDIKINGTPGVDIVRYYADSIFTSSTVFMEDRVNKTPSGKQVINEINNTQYGFIGFINHGLPMGIPVYGRGGGGDDHRKFSWIWAIEGEHAPNSATHHANDDTTSGNGLNNMANKYYPSICYSPGCELMPFDIPSGYESASMLFGESFTTGKNYGGPAFLGNTRENGMDNMYLGSIFCKFVINGFYKIGMAQPLARIYVFDPGEKMIFNLLGDPEFEIWTDIPQHFTNVSLSRSDNSITVNGIDSDSTIVAYYSNDGQIGTDTISTLSVVFNNISPNSTVMLYKHNYIPYIAPLDLQNITFSKNQYVIASDVNAGEAIDSQRTNGNVIVPDGIEYEIEASGRVTLQDGFQVEKGATFAVYPSSF